MVDNGIDGEVADKEGVNANREEVNREETNRAEVNRVEADTGEGKNGQGAEAGKGGGKVRVEDLLAAGRAVQISPRGYSMYPLLVPGRDQVILAPAEREAYQRGEVVLYRREGSILVLHRIWKRQKDGYYMVGDNQKEVEGPIGREQILGVLVCILRNGRRIPVENAWYRVLAAVWLWLRPVRPFLSHTAAWVKRILSAICSFCFLRS